MIVSSLQYLHFRSVGGEVRVLDTGNIAKRKNRQMNAG